MAADGKGKTMMSMFKKVVPALLASVVTFGIMLSAVGAEPKIDPNLNVKVKKSNGKIIVDVSMLTPASQQQVWDVLTDFDHMTNFLSNLKSSKILRHDGNKIQVEQTGKATQGIFSFSFDTVREITLAPLKEINSHVLSGSIKQADASTHLIVEGNATRIVYHSESVAASMVPAVISVKFVDQQVRKQYTEIRDEILHRKNETAK
jgi:uncharacterized membrane protein